MYSNQFVISIGVHKKVIYAKILSETNAITCVASMANTQTNRCLVNEKEVYELKKNSNCAIHTYKVKNHKYKTIHKYLIYNFMNTQDRLTFMDNLVKFLVVRKFPNLKKSQIFELLRTKTKDKQSVCTRMLQENPKAVVSPRAKVYCKKKKCTVEDKSGKSEIQHSSNNNNILKQRIILQIPVLQTCNNLTNIKVRKTSLESKQKRKSLHLQKKITNPSKPMTRNIIRENTQCNNLKNITI